jgi:DNA polymerase elongation subunit (family B)
MFPSKSSAFCLLALRLTIRRSSRVLEHILSGRPTEEVVNEIHEYLTTMGNDLREGRVELDDLIVHKVMRFSCLLSCTSY